LHRVIREYRNCIIRAALMLPLEVATRVMSFYVVWMKLTPSKHIIGVSFAALVATILLQKFMISDRLEKATMSGRRSLPDVIPVPPVD